MKNKLNKEKIKSIISYTVFYSFIIPIGFIIYKIVVAPTTNIDNIEGFRIKTDYILMLIQCILGIIAMIVPKYISKKNKIEIPSNLYLMFYIFLYAAIFLGEVKSFYYNVPHWDVILHAFSGAMLGALGFSLIDLISGSEKTHMSLSPIFVAIFAFSFAISLGVVWEIYEFSFDGLLGLNMQKFTTYGGEVLVGRAALMDTMKDLIVDFIGAGCTVIIGYISLKYKKSWIENLLIRKVD